MSDEPLKTAGESPGEGARPLAEAEAARIRAEVAATDERRVEEELARKREEIEKATKREQELAEKEREAERKAAEAAAEADRLRGQAGPPAPAPSHTPPAAAVAGLPLVDSLPPAAQRPEVVIGAAFAGAFVAAKILKAIFD
jgi:multidrug efflux pump subunit AcrA (membrane-fusion protein)